MTTSWQNHSGHRLSIEADTVRLLPSQETCSGDQFLAGTLNERVLSTFDLMTLTEALALLTAARLPDAQRPPQAENTALRGRPWFARDEAFSDASGKVWFFGRTLAVDAKGQPRVEVPLAVVACDGLAECRSRLSAELADAVEQAARQLVPMPCLCGTGCQRPHEHDALTSLVRRQHPHAPIDYSVTVYWCRVCARWWTYMAVGDSHYSYSYTVRQCHPGRHADV
jgi:hypothetical protein